MRMFFRFMSGFIIGGLVGAAAAILLTPLSGEDLRLRLQTEAGRIQSEVKRAATDRRAELEQQLAAMRSPNR